MVGFLQARAVAGVERFHDGGYSRSFGVEGHRGLIHLAPDEEAQGLRGEPSPGAAAGGGEIRYARVGQLFDLACDPRQVARIAGRSGAGAAGPGLHLPGALDAFGAGGARGAGPAGERGDGRFRLTAKVAAGWGEPLAEAPSDTSCSRRQRSCPGPIRRR